MNCSDFIVVVMTSVRFQVVQSADQFEVHHSDEARKSRCYCILAILCGLLLNVPHLMHYKIIECQDIQNCWTFEQNPLTQTVFWEVLGYINVFVANLHALLSSYLTIILESHIHYLLAKHFLFKCIYLSILL